MTFPLPTIRSRALPALALITAALLSACASAPTDAAAIHKQSLVLDAHADIAIPSIAKNFLAADGLSKVDPSKLNAGGVDAVVMSVAVGPGPRTVAGRAAARALADEKLAAALALAEGNPDVVIATSVEAVEQAEREGKVALILGLQNARSLQGNLGALDEFYAKGVRVFGLNHLGHNDFSDSSRPIYDGETGKYEATEEQGGLSPLGRAAIQRINRLGGVVDVSQMSKAATLETIALSTAPVIASHSNVRAISNVTRNLSDEEIDAIGGKGGVIHIAPFGAYLVSFSDPKMLADIITVRRKAGLPDEYSYPYELYWELKDPADKMAFLTEMRSVIGPGTVADMLDHIDYVAARIGVDHVGIGTDFNHGSAIEGFSDASEALNVTTGLVKRGYSAEDIQKIWGGNFLRVFAEAAQLAE